MEVRGRGAMMCGRAGHPGAASEKRPGPAAYIPRIACGQNYLVGRTARKELQRVPCVALSLLTAGLSLALRGPAFL
jgi:hypothetical protein